MNHNDTFLRDVLLSGLEPSDELRDRFEEQVEQIVPVENRPGWKLVGIAQ